MSQGPSERCLRLALPKGSLQETTQKLLSRAGYEVRISSRPVTLTATEFRLLYHLVRNRGRVYTRAQLLEQVVGHEVIVVERNIDVHVSALRRKLGDEGLRIETIRGVGYKFSERV